MAFEELTDPQGINFWPEPVGRDNTRTPMVWDGSEFGGFSTVKPWLPVKAPQLARNVASQLGVAGSVLEFYRSMIGFRKGSAALMAGRTVFHDVAEPVLAFTRDTGAEALLCVFNLSSEGRRVQVEGVSGLVGPSLEAVLSGGALTLGPNAVAFIAVSGVVKVTG